MKKASRWFGKEERAAIAAAIAAAEAQTSAQIVPVIATASGRYDRAEDLFGLTLALLALALTWVIFQEVTVEGWSGQVTIALGLPVIAAVVFGGFVVGTVLASHFYILRQPFIPRSEMRAEVERSANAAFKTHHVRRTADGNGLLIYVSLQERMVRVLGDDQIAERISKAEWDAICQAIVDGMQRGDASGGLIDALDKAGTVLRGLLPRSSDDGNEFADQLIFID